MQLEVLVVEIQVDLKRQHQVVVVKVEQEVRQVQMVVQTLEAVAVEQEMNLEILQVVMVVQELLSFVTNFNSYE
jgi:hypothetical protein